MTKKSFRRAFRDSLPIMAGYLALGIGYGVLLQSKGYSFWWAILMSVTMFAGSGQYAGVDFMASGASLLTTAFMTLIINCRHFFYGVSLLDKYRGTGIVKPYLIFGLTDETYSVVCTAKLDDDIDLRITEDLFGIRDELVTGDSDVPLPVNIFFQDDQIQVRFLETPGKGMIMEGLESVTEELANKLIFSTFRDNGGMTVVHRLMEGTIEPVVQGTLCLPESADGQEPVL